MNKKSTYCYHYFTDECQSIAIEFTDNEWTMKNEVLEPMWTEKEEELSLPQDVIDDLLNDVHDFEEEDEGDCIFQNVIDDTLDTDDSDEA